MKSETVWKRLLRREEMPVLGATVLLCVIFSAFSSNFLTPFNIFNVTRMAALYMFVALAQTMVMIVGGMNVSLGSCGALCVVVCGHCLQNMHMASVPAMLLTLLTGIVCGLLNGLIITKLNINAFVATLATQFVFAGLATGISQGYPYTEINKSFTVLGRGMFLGLPYMVYLAALFLIIVWYIFRFTVMGRRILATGGNQKAAQMAAVNTGRMILLANIFSGFFAAVSAICSVSMNGAAQPATGADWMIYSFAISVIGGTALSGGVIRPLGIFIAGIMIVIIRNGLIMLKLNVYFEQTYLGLILLIAVSLGSLTVALKEAQRRRRFRKEHAQLDKQ